MRDPCHHKSKKAWNSQVTVPHPSEITSFDSAYFMLRRLVRPSWRTTAPDGIPVLNAYCTSCRRSSGRAAGAHHTSTLCFPKQPGSE
jgi:hypothetical protein